MRAKASAVAEIDDCTARWHRTYSAHRRHGCSCPSANAARRRYDKQIRTGLVQQKVVDGIGTQRRLRGLAVDGFTAGQILEITSKFGCFRINEIYTKPNCRVRVETEHAVRVAVAVLSQRPRPAGWVADRVRTKAAQRGWWPLDAWFRIDHDPEPSTVDEITVMHAVAGDFRWDQLGEQEQALVVRELRARQWSDVRIAEHLRTSHSHIARARGRVGIPAVPRLQRNTA